MGKYIDFLERKLGKYAINRLPLVIIICYAIGYIMQLINPEIIFALSLNPYAIVHGQVWRLITWVLIPPDSSNLFFTLIMLYFYYSIGCNLEQTWGKFYFNYYIFSGMIYTIIASFLIYAYFVFFMPEALVNDLPALYGYSSVMSLISVSFFSTYYINMSIFLAYSATYPDMHVLLFFILPIKVKVLGIIYAVLMIYDALQYWLMFGDIMMTAVELVAIIASLLNFIIFFLSTKKRVTRTKEQMRMAREFKKKVQEDRTRRMRPQSSISKHKCAICGQTGDDNPNLEFRFCSKCEGNYEYCQNHLFTHTHVKRQ